MEFRGHLTDAIRLNLDDVPLLDLLSWPPSPLRGLIEPGYASAEKFLLSNGLPPQASPHELAIADQQSLASSLALAHLRSGRPAQDVARLFGPVPAVERPERMTLPHLAGLLDAAARQGESGLALGYLLGDTSARGDLESILTRFIQEIRHALQTFETNPPTDYGSFRSFQVETTETLEPVVDWAVRRVVGPDKIAVGFVAATPNRKVHAVAPVGWTGGHLGRSLAHAAASTGGRGDGTADRASATVPAPRFPEFLQAFETQLAPATVETPP